MLKSISFIAFFVTLTFSSIFSICAQDAGPVTTIQTQFKYVTQDLALNSKVWTTGQAASVSLTSRWANAVRLQGTLKSDFSSSALTDKALGELSITWNASQFAIATIGLQRLQWGTARVFSSIDSLEPPLDPLNLKDTPQGVGGLKIEFLPADWLSFWTLAIPSTSKRLEDTTYATKFDVLIDDADVSVGAVRTIANPLLSNGTRSRRDSYAIFADAARFFDRFGFYGEAQLRYGRNRDWALFSGATMLSGQLESDPSWTLSGTAGFQLDVPVWLNGTIHVLSEYHYLQDGFDEAEALQLRNALYSGQTFVSPNGLSVGAFRKHYAFLGLFGIPLVERLDFGCSALAGLDGGILVSAANLTWRIGQAIEIAVEYRHFDTWNGNSDSTEMFFLPNRNTVSLTATSWY